jgi:oligoribonuclease
MASSKKSKNLIWIDLEMTGLNPEHDRIIEIATIVTDLNLKLIAEGPVFAIFQPQSLLDTMDAWNVKHHTQSGLVARVQESQVSEEIAMRETIKFLELHIGKGLSPMCGNSICQDRRFLAKYMPALEAYFHYRMIDVSTFKECARRWYPEVYKGFSKKSKHQALADIRESIEELRYYRQNMLMPI